MTDMASLEAASAVLVFSASYQSFPSSLPSHPVPSGRYSQDRLCNKIVLTVMQEATAPLSKTIGEADPVRSYGN